MLIFDLIRLANPSITPEQSKIHLASWNGREEPMDVYVAGEFNEWQRWQSRKNFERKYVISLIKLPSSERWLFAGVHFSKSPSWDEKRNEWHYELMEDSECSEMNGRMVVSFTRSGRQSYLNAETWAGQLLLSEFLAEPVSIGDFPGFKLINLTKAELDLIFKQSLLSWRTALSNVAGIYLISDTASGKLYVGSAVGEGGIWQRWGNYCINGHGGNVELRKLLSETGIQRAKHFRFSVLEIADTHASIGDILRRETHWKNILLSRDYGLNSN